MSAYESRQLLVAANAFERELAADPGHSRARLQLERTLVEIADQYRDIGDEEQARRYYQAAARAQSATGTATWKLCPKSTSFGCSENDS